MANAISEAPNEAPARCVVAVEGVEKTYKGQMFVKPMRAVNGVSFDVLAGEIVGLVGPNGAGKTTTIKMILGLCWPDKGSVTIMGKPADDPDARQSVGFLPENPYCYPYLTPIEYVSLIADLSSVPKNHPRNPEWALERTGIAHAKHRAIRKLSKGQVQRTALAAAIVGEPQLLVLDEPMSGLDPIGRREVRDILFEERSAGRTVLFSSHVLSDVEAMCDRVIILREGRVVVAGKISELIRKEATLREVVLRGVTADQKPTIESHGRLLRYLEGELAIEVEGESSLRALLEFALAEHLSIQSILPRFDSLEDLFMRNAVSEGAVDRA